jgi:hypothetical protein
MEPAAAGPLLAGRSSFFFCSTPSKETAALLVSAMRRRGQRTREMLLEIGASTVNKVDLMAQ